MKHSLKTVNILRVQAIVLLTWFLASLFAVSGHAQWQRAKRVAVYRSPQRARYPALVKGLDGSLLVVFTRQTAEQEAKGHGDLMLMRSADQGQTWSPARIIHKSGLGEPRAAGTMTRLNSGDLILPVAVLQQRQTTSQVPVLTSADSGRSWKSLDTAFDVPLDWWVPRGKLIETDNGQLVMPIYGAADLEDLQNTIHNCGVLRSCDGGKTWGSFSWIARGARSVIGAASVSRFSFEGPSISVLPDGRCLNNDADGPGPVNKGLGAPQVLCRLWSSDQGRTWTKAGAVDAWRMVRHSDDRQAHTVGQHSLGRVG